MPVNERAFGVSVVLTSGENSSDLFTARRNKIESMPIGTDFAVRVNVEMRKYMLPITSCVIDSVQVKPASGMTVTEGGTTWKILPPEEYALSVELSEGESDWECYTKKISG